MKENYSRYYLIKKQAQPYYFSDKVSPKMSETLGALIRRRMKDLDIRTNSELAKLLGKSDAYVGDLVNDKAKTQSGIYRPRPKTISKLSEILEISENEILKAIGYKGDYANTLPKGLHISDFDGFDDGDIAEIKRYLKFKKLEKEEREKVEQVDDEHLLSNAKILKRENDEHLLSNAIIYEGRREKKAS